MSGNDSQNILTMKGLSMKRYFKNDTPWPIEGTKNFKENYRANKEPSTNDLKTNTTSPLESPTKEYNGTCNPGTESDVAIFADKLNL